MKGASEWDATAADLKRLVEAYSTTFPLPEGAAARRLGDKEVVAHVADALSKDAKELKKRVSDGKPSSAQARAVIDAANKLDGHLAPVEITTLSGVFRDFFWNGERPAGG